MAPNIHMKGYILLQLNDAPDGLWDYEIASQVLKDYDVDKNTVFWKGEVRATLTDMFSGALIEELEDKLDDGEHFGPERVLCKFRLTPFGRERMQETGIL